MYACVFVCMNANAREEHPNLALTCTQSSFVCVCVRGCITDALWYRLLKRAIQIARRTLSVGTVNAGPSGGR